MSRVVNTSVDDSGNAGGSPYLVKAVDWDTINEIDNDHEINSPVRLWPVAVRP
jgi:hypothetical protein